MLFISYRPNLTYNARFASQRRREVLVRAREAVLADYHNLMLASGDASEVPLKCALLR